MGMAASTAPTFVLGLSSSHPAVLRFNLVVYVTTGPNSPSDTFTLQWRKGERKLQVSGFRIQVLSFYIFCDLFVLCGEFSSDPEKGEKN
jgi:hypothetical protein